MDTEEDGAGVIFRDLLFLILLGFVVLVVLMIPHLNPPGSRDADGSPPPGQVSVEIRWPDESGADVDLWVQAPGDVPVGYSNKGGAAFNLLRDDLGKRADALELNYENAYTRGIPAGEYTVNVHAYRGDRNWPVPVKVVVSTRYQNRTVQLLASKVELHWDGQELTVFRFKLNEKGVLVPGSVHNLNKPLRSARK